jgi:putative FmdB family regulatory protein
VPIFEFLCKDCGKTNEILVFNAGDQLKCPACKGENLKKLLSAHASVQGSSGHEMPGPGDTACCGSSPGMAGCAGPGSCCGKT